MSTDARLLHLQSHWLSQQLRLFIISCECVFIGFWKLPSVVAVLSDVESKRYQPIFMRCDKGLVMASSIITTIKATFRREQQLSHCDKRIFYVMFCQLCKHIVAFWRNLEMQLFDLKYIIYLHEKYQGHSLFDFFLSLVNFKLQSSHCYRV